ncbi:hypothetical protein CRUP_031817 [Coryphaenoides rupestris]|nr:hypothetical protein CRUP_031817 [Coryphaenoides rupestris]
MARPPPPPPPGHVCVGLCVSWVSAPQLTQIQAKTRELRERQAKEREYAEIQERRWAGFSSDEEHPYAGIGSLDSSVDSGHADSLGSHHHYHLPHSPQTARAAPRDDARQPPLEALYAQVNKPRGRRPQPPPSSDR